MSYSQIAIIRLSSLGDIIHTLPAFLVLRKNFPGARITWIAEPSGAKLLENIQGIDEIVPLNLKKPKILGKVKNLRNFLKRYRNRFELVLDFQGLIKSAVLSSLLKGKTLGFHAGNLREAPARFFYHDHAEKFDETEHVILKNIQLVKKALGETPPGLPGPGAIEYPGILENEGKILKDFFARHHLEEKNYILVNIGGGWDTKTLTEKQNAETIDRLKTRYKIAVLWGNDKEKTMAAKISAVTGVPATPFLGFGDLFALIRKARLLISGDTLALHISDMVGTPSVGIFGPTSPSRNGSLLKESQHVYENLECNFCYKRKCDTIKCIKQVKVERIVKAIENITHEALS